MDQAQFLQQLQIILNPSQGNVKEATNTLQKVYYKNPEALLFLIQIATTHHDADLKQLAAVEARSLAIKLWGKVPDAQKPQVREQLLRSTLSESSALVRHACARVISAIAEIDLTDGEWADLPQFLLNASTSAKAEERAVGTYILFAILETLGEGFEEKFMDLFALFEKTIRDPESAEVRINTLLALSKLAVHLDSDEDEKPVKAFQQIFPAMVNVLKDTIDQGDDARIMQAFEVYQTLLGCDPELLNPHLKDLVIFMNEISANTKASDDTRTQAISFLMQAVSYRKIRIQGMQLGDQLTRTCLAIATELDSLDSDEDDITPARSALGLLDMMSQSFAPSQVVVPLLTAVGQYFNSSDASHRRAGIMSLGMCIDGAPDFISTQMHEIFPVLFRLLQDPEASVRQATLDTVARLADVLPDDVSKQHQTLMPLLLKNLASAMQEYNGDESSPAVDMIKSSLSATDTVVDGMEGKDVAPYQNDLVPLLQKLFKHPDFKIKGHTASALGSVASSAGEAFLPYFDESMHIMQEFATLKHSEEELELRASVIDAMGEMSSGAGPEHFKNYVGPLMQASEEALHLDHSRLKESTYLFWGVMSKVYGSEFTPYLEGVVKALITCLEQNETEMEVSLGDAAKDLVGQEVTIAGHKVRVAGADDNDDDDDDEFEDVDDWENLNTVTPVSLEKEIAIEVLGDVITHTGKSFMPFFEMTMQHILPLTEHSYEGVRKSAMSTLHRSYAALWQVCEETGQMQKWQPGKNMPLSEPPNELKKLGEILMKVTLQRWAEEDDPSAISDINRNFADNLRFCGPYLISNRENLEKVTSLVTSIITKQHPCQLDIDATEEDREMMEELSEFDWNVIDTALDVVSGLAIALGAEFVALWPAFEKYVLRFAASSESLERSTSIGVLADVISGLGNAITPYTGNFFRLFTHRLTDEDMQTRSNTCYAVGMLVEKSEADAELVAAYPTILEKVTRCLQIQQARLPDNAAGCVARLIIKHHENVPLEEVLPALVDILPLQNDFDENEPIYRMICQLYKWENPTISQLTPRLLPIFESVLTGDSDQLDDERRAELIELVKWINKMQPGGAAAFVEKLSS
ncbi:importin subunit beta [Trichophyton mentagrophytes]|uniref:Importin N-terminal domain-containing protein n=1 Tax=Trichophyton interdigitale (strain MR816) TaxID=1215338 RepID=A0A059J9N6_TRIIM|nr:hypothetical protein H101_05568 [Trichophyton interdigitale H6]KAG5206064.1 Importin subunit beta [Trichophyton interdigitale]KDB24398.1 hypothetical protein H109_03746 [Trichophyton interdigitale MR816]GBF63541.1 importin subunit beta [Trichophyton mentagrophytes]KAG5217528.1 Importin subunit beta [Trichophyton interdigitale]